jgi:hypothetical protein
MIVYAFIDENMINGFKLEEWLGEILQSTV